MSESPFVSFAQNGEDVVLWRALSGVQAGRYVEVGANHPTVDSVSRAFYDRGWSGVTIEPVPQYAALQREARPRDRQLEVAISSAPGDTVTLHVVPDTGLSSLSDEVRDAHLAAGRVAEDLQVRTARLDDVLAETGWGHDDIQFLLVDVEGAEPDVLSTLDLTTWRPWVLVIESIAPNSTVQTHHVWEPGVLDAGYELCLFDGLSRFYVAAERADELRDRLSYPACALDEFMRFEVVAARTDAANAAAEQGEVVEDLTGQLLHWRTQAVVEWASRLATPPDTSDAEIRRLRRELRAMRSSTSWKVTKPLRAARRLLRKSSR